MSTTEAAPITNGLSWKAEALRSTAVDGPSPTSALTSASRAFTSLIGQRTAGCVRRHLPAARTVGERQPAAGSSERCVTTSGHRLHASAFKRTLAWASIANGRRIHDLRHTRACLWLARGVDPVTVQAWMGHASIAPPTSICTIWEPQPIGPVWTV